MTIERYPRNVSTSMRNSWSGMKRPCFFCMCVTLRSSDFESKVQKRHFEGLNSTTSEVDVSVGSSDSSVMRSMEAGKSSFASNLATSCAWPFDLK